MTTDLEIIGSTEYVDVAGVKNVPAKVDTGADSSSIWASHIEIDKDGVLSFCLFGKGSPFYTGEIMKRKDYKVAIVRSSSGHEQIRYRTHFDIKIDGRKIKALFNLSDRSRNKYPVLIGRRTINGKFLVDVSEKNVSEVDKGKKTETMQRELEKNPYKFHQKYIKKGKE